MEVSVGDLCDRLSILRIKELKQKGGDFSLEKEEYERGLNDFFDSSKGMSTQNEVLAFLVILGTLNGLIWNREGDIRQGKEGGLGLEEVGKRAVQIRDINEIRVLVKNLLNNLTGTGFTEIKHVWK